MWEDDRKDRMDQEENRRREDDRKDRMDQEENRRREEREREDRHRQLIQQLQDRQPAVPQTVHVSQLTLPSMKESDDIEEFITCLEIALKSAGTNRAKWRHSLLTQLTQSSSSPFCPC